MTSCNREDLAHFLRLAKRGKITGASGGEKRAAKLAAAILENTPGMDISAILGAVDFIAVVNRDYSAGAEMLD